MTKDVELALCRQNVGVPSGRIESLQREFTVLAQTDLRTPAQFNDLIIKDATGYLVRLSDVGRAELGALDERRIVRFNEELFTELGWLQVMWGQGLRPEGYPPHADQLTPEQLNEFMAVSHKHAAHVAGQMPLHRDYITAHCAAPPLEIKKALP